jgi:hypothetical protein
MCGVNYQREVLGDFNGDLAKVDWWTQSGIYETEKETEKCSRASQHEGQTHEEGRIDR